MIVISGVLLLVAVVFLVIGLFGSLAWVYASIGVSVASFLFLLVGVRQRREEPASSAATTPATPATPAAPLAARPSTADDEEVTVVPTSPSFADDDSSAPISALTGDAEPAAPAAAATTGLRRTPAKKTTPRGTAATTS